MEPGVKSAEEVSNYMLFFILLILSSPGFGAIYDLEATLLAVSRPIKRVAWMLVDRSSRFVSEGELEFLGLEHSICLLYTSPSPRD